VIHADVYMEGMDGTDLFPLGGSSPFVHDGLTYTVPCYRGNGSTALDLSVDADFKCAAPKVFNKCVLDVEERYVWPFLPPFLPQLYLALTIHPWHGIMYLSSRRECEVEKSLTAQYAISDHT
jgi:hypothetical protein